jgi:hypothetical protein
VSCHTFRHSFATHLLELLGHSNVPSTIIYTHVLNRGLFGVRSTADLLLSTIGAEEVCITRTVKGATPADSTAQNGCAAMDLSGTAGGYRLHGRQIQYPEISENAPARKNQPKCPCRDTWLCVDHTSAMHPEPGARIRQNPVTTRDFTIAMQDQPCIGGASRSRRRASQNRLLCN